MPHDYEESTIQILRQGMILPSVLWLIDQYRERHLESPTCVAVNVALQKGLEEELARLTGVKKDTKVVQSTYIDGCRVIYFYCSPIALRFRPDAEFLVVYRDDDLVRSRESRPCTI